MNRAFLSPSFLCSPLIFHTLFRGVLSVKGNMYKTVYHVALNFCGFYFFGFFQGFSCSAKKKKVTAKIYSTVGIVYESHFYM